jgi:predicted NUDIX family NTP pyrophosphohydrolase
MPKVRQSAGILLYRELTPGQVEVFLAHPGGPYWAKKDEGHWTIPKGEPDDTETDLLTVALREFREETGISLHADGPYIPLGSITQKGGKVVHAWAVRGEADPTAIQSNEIEIEWPPRSRKRITIPEVDRCAWFSPEEARVRIKEAQIPLIERLLDHLSTGVSRASAPSPSPRECRHDGRGGEGDE